MKTSTTRIQWFKNGDHPEDSVMRPFEDTGEKPTQPREGAVVRYFCHPDVDSNEICDICGYTMGRHGYLEKSINEHTTVCPGDCIEKVGSDRYRIVNEGNEGILLEKKIKTATQEHQTKKRQQETTHETYTYNDSDDIRLPMTSSKTHQHMALINAINNNMPDNIIENIIQLIGTMRDDKPLCAAIKQERVNVVKEILNAFPPKIRHKNALQTLVDSGNVMTTLAMVDLLYSVSTDHSIHETILMAAAKTNYTLFEVLMNKVVLTPESLNMVFQHIDQDERLLSCMLQHVTKYGCKEMTESTVKKLDILKHGRAKEAPK